jgi:single-strand DNA-binding protein
MNKVQLSGRLTKDVTVTYSGNGNSIARITLAVDRTVKKGDKWEHEADFIPCVAFGKKAEFLERYFKKGSFAIVSGNIKTGSYEKEDGTKVYTTDVWIEDVEFGGSKNEGSDSAPAAKSNDGFMSIPDGIEEEMPFN